MRSRLLGSPIRAACAVALVGALGAVGGGGTLAPSACAATRAGAQRVALVVDFGTVTSEPGAPGGVVRTCVVVGARASGADVLTAAGYSIRWKSDGTPFVCGIGGYPSSGCGDASGTHYLYWAYWKGTAAGGWKYASVGAASRVSPGTVEGWRFVDGRDSSSSGSPSPRAAPDPAAICPPPVTGSTAPPTTHGTTGPAPPPTAHPGSAGTGGPAPTVPPTAPTGSAPTTARHGSSTTSRHGARPQGAAPSSTVAGGAPQEASGVPIGAGAPAEADRAIGTRLVKKTGSGTPWSGFVLGVSLVLATLGAGVVVARRRRLP